MLDLLFGDICICDLSYSINTPKVSRAPLLYLYAEEGEGRIMYRFCRIGREPVKPSLYPFVRLPKMPNLKEGSTAYPTQMILFPSDDGIKYKIGSLSDVDCCSQIEQVINAWQKEMKQALIMTLCPKCLRDFMLDTSTIIKRLDPFSLHQDKCNFCQTRNGYTYLIVKKKSFGGYRNHEDHIHG